MKTRPLLRSGQLATAIFALFSATLAHAGDIWDGEGANTNISTGTNWDADTAPILDDVVSTTLTFGTGGNTATIDTTVAVLGVIINRDADFTLAAGSGTLKIGSSGITVSIPTDEVRNHFITQNVVLDVNQVWQVGGTPNTSDFTSTLTVSGVISEQTLGRSLGLNNGAVLALTATNSYTGGTLVTNGTLRLGHATNTLADSGPVSVYAAGILDIGDNSDTVGSVLLSGGTINGLTGTLTGSAYDVQSGFISANLGGTGVLTKTSAGTASISAETSYTGGTLVSQGTLTLSTSDALFDSGVVTVNGTGSFFAIGNNSDTVGTVILTNGGFITGSNGILSGSSYDLQSGTVTAKLGGSGILTKSTTGTVNLNSVSTYSGNTIIKGGILKLNNTATFANSPKIVVGDAGSSGAVLDLTLKTSGFSIGASQTLSGIGTIDVDTGALKRTLTIAGTHSPGNSPGIQTVEGHLAYAAASVFEWELSSNVTTGRGTNFDGVNVTGDTTINASAIFKIVLGTDFDPAASFWDSRQVWSVFDVAGAKASVFSTFEVWDANGVDADTKYTTDYSSQGYFSYAYNTDGLGANSGNLIWTAVPEPTSALAGLLLGAGLLRRRRKLA